MSLAILACAALVQTNLADAGPAIEGTAPAPSPSPATEPSDGLVLTVSPGPGQGEVILRWTGGLAPYTIYRSTFAAMVIDPGNRQGDTTSQAWLDMPPPGAIYF